MNKTVTINISGLIFNIDEIAYGKLKNYLESIERYFKTSEGGQEIMTDIEGRIAEMFSERISDRKEVISVSDVDQMIGVMGQPEEFVDEETREENARKSDSSEEQYQEERYTENEEEFDRGPKRFFRDPDGRIVGGVCSGIGYYFGIDPVIIRLLFVVAVLLGFSGILIYIIFWIITPKATTRAEKLQMRGRKVNIDNIRQTVKEEAQDVKKNFKNLDDRVESFATSNQGKRIGNFFQTFGNFIFSILKNILRFVGKFLGLLLIIFGALFLFSFLTSLIGFTMIDGIFTVNGATYSMNAGEAGNLIFSSSWIAYVFMTGLGLAIGIPLLFLFLVGIKIVFNTRDFGKPVGFSIIGFWALGIVLCFLGGSFLARDFSKSDESIQQFTLAPSTADTMNVFVNEAILPAGMKETYAGDFFNLVRMSESGIQLSNVKFNVVESRTDSIEVSVVLKSRGATYKDARLSAENIGFSYLVDGADLTLDPYYSVNKGDNFRFQEVYVNLGIPVGKTVYLSDESSWVIYDIDNVTNTHDRYMNGKYWTMTENGLACLHCKFGKTKRGGSRGTDLNSMSVRELERKLESVNREIELIQLDFDRKISRKTRKIEKEMLKWEELVNDEDNSTKVKEYRLKLEELQEELQMETRKLRIEMKEAMKEFETTSEEILDLIDNKSEETVSEEVSPKFPEKKKAVTLEESNSNEPNLRSRLLFPNPFQILI